LKYSTASSRERSFILVLKFRLLVVRDVRPVLDGMTRTIPAHMKTSTARVCLGRVARQTEEKEEEGRFAIGAQLEIGWYSLSGF
jgi:hypothetical protein